MAHFRTVRISCSTRASCSLILYCSSMNSSGLKQQETGTHVTALTLWPRYQPPFFFVRLQTLPGTLIHYHRATLHIRPTLAQSLFSVPFSNAPVQEDKTFVGHTGFQWINLQQSSTREKSLENLSLYLRCNREPSRQFFSKVTRRYCPHLAYLCSHLHI